MWASLMLAVTVLAATYTLLASISAIDAMCSRDSMARRLTYITAAVTAAGTLLCPVFYPGKLGYIEAALVVSLAAVMALPHPQQKETH